MSNFIHMFSGRKRDSEVWKYFDYIADINKSRCTIVNEKTKKPCGTSLAGKNPTNLKFIWVDIMKKYGLRWRNISLKAEKGKNC
jgi:hypothetical protein